MDRLKAILSQATDDEVLEILAVCMNESTSRRDHIMEDAKTRLSKFDAILPKPGAIAPERREELPTSAPSMSPPDRFAPPPTPKMLQCPAVNPNDATTKCTQPRNHEGQHYNHSLRIGWLNRNG